MLVVEDDPTFAKLLKTILESSKQDLFQTVVADTLQNAQKELHEGTFDVIIADLGLPDSKDYATLESLSRTAPEVPVVVLTGTADSGIGQSLEAVRRGAAYFLRKGNIDPAAVERGVRYALGRHQLRNLLQDER